MTAKKELTLPTKVEHAVAMEAFTTKGDPKKIRQLLRRKRDWLLQAGSKPFDRQKFIAGRASRGEHWDEEMIINTRRLVEEMRGRFLRDAAEACALLGGLASLYGDHKTAARHYTQAAELDSSNTEYGEKAKENMRLAASTK